MQRSQVKHLAKLVIRRQDYLGKFFNIFAPPGIMDYYFTYEQRDTTRSRVLLDLNTPNSNPAILDVGRTTIAPGALKIEFTERQKAPQSLTPAQIRYLRNKAEEKLLVDNSRFMKIRDVECMDLRSFATANNLILPEHRISRVSFDWMTIVLSLCLLLFATVRIPYAKFLGHMFQSLVNYPTASRMFRERNQTIVHGAFRLDIFFYIIFSLFIYQVLKHYGVDMSVSNFIFYLFCVVAVLGYYLLKRMLYTITGKISNGQAETSEYWFNQSNYNRTLGLFLSPLVVVIAFSPRFNPHLFVVVGLIIAAIFYGMSLQRGIQILLKKQFPIFYLFLYLCTLEILPLLLILKMVLA